MQVLKPATQRKVRTLGGNYQEILSQWLLSVPSFLGGNCSCSKCVDGGAMQDAEVESASMPPEAEHVDNHFLDVHLPTANYISENGDQSKRTLIIGLLTLWILILVILGMHHPEKLSVW